MDNNNRKCNYMGIKKCIIFVFVRFFTTPVMSIRIIHCVLMLEVSKVNAKKSVGSDME